MHVIEDLDGVTVARGQATADLCHITLMAASGFSEGTYFPAESLAITSLAGVAALRDLCERLIEAHMEAAQAGGA